MLKPFGNRVLLKITKVYAKEKGKPVLGQDGLPQFSLAQKAKVLQSNVPEIKKGMTVYPIIRGGVPIYHLETKNDFVYSLDAEDIYALEN